MANPTRERAAKTDRPATAARRTASSEPRLHEMLDDPITRRLMASDGVRREHLVRLMSEARAKLAQRRA